MSPDDPELVETLRLAQRLGVLGGGPVGEAVRHADQYVTALVEVPVGARAVDLGSGGGLPGLVIARRRPDLELLLIDRREKRADFLERAVRRLGLDVEVRCDDVGVLVEEVRSARCDRFDAVTARSFGPPASTMRTARCLVSAGGVLVVSEPPDRDRWDADLLVEMRARRELLGGVSRFTFDA